MHTSESLATVQAIPEKENIGRLYSVDFLTIFYGVYYKNQTVLLKTKSFHLRNS